MDTNHQEFDITRPLGASAYETSFDEEKQITIGLPQLVWLRGDEPYYEEFSLNADEVMENLGIKRSRLNQISGKELRVGRTKKGRYIRPVYRAFDVEQYQSWVRPSASHKKSSEILTDAVKALGDTAHEIEEIINETSPKWIKSFEDHLKQVILQESKQQLFKAEQAQRKSQKQWSFLLDDGEKKYSILKNHMFDLIVSLSNIDSNMISTDLFKRVCAEILTAISEIQSVQNSQIEYHQEKLEFLSDLVSSQSQLLSEIRENQEHAEEIKFKLNRVSSTKQRQMLHSKSRTCKAKPRKYKKSRIKIPKFN